MLEMWRKTLEYSLGPCLAILVYWNTFQAKFAYDDNRAILDNEDLRPEISSWFQLWFNDFWGTPLRHTGSHKSFRPLCVATFRLNYAIHGLHPAGYHIVNVLLHSLTTGLFQHVLRKVTRKDNVAFIAGLLFAVHPVHTEAVAGVVGRADLGAAFFFLMSFLAYVYYCQFRDQGANEATGFDLIQTKQALGTSVKCGLVIIPVMLATSCVCAFTSCLFKETGITVIGLCLFYDIVILQGFRSPLEVFGAVKKSHNKRLEGSFSLLCWLCLVLTARILWMGSLPPRFAPADNPAADSPFLLTRFLTFAYLPVLNLKLLVDPHTLSYDWSMDAVPLITSWFDRRNLFSVFLYGGLLLLAKRLSRMTCTSSKEQSRRVSEDERIALAVVLLIIPFLPATNIFFYVGFVLAERILYVPSMGFAWLMAEGLIKAFNYAKSPLQRRTIAVGFCGIMLAHSMRTWERNYDWMTEEKLYLSGTRINPAKSWSNLGNIWSQRGKLKEAEIGYRRALMHKPNMADAHYNLGLLLQQQRRMDESIASYRSAITFRHNMAVAHLNLGMALQGLGRQREAEETYRHCAQLDVSLLKDPKLHDSAKITCLYNLGRLFVDEQRYQDALDVFTRAVSNRPGHYAPQGLYNMLGEAYSHLNRPDLAERWYQMALETQPDHVTIHLTYARFLYKQNRTAAAEHIFSTVLHSAPNDSTAYQFYGQYLMDSGRIEEGVKVLLKGAKMYPHDFQCLTNVAGALRQSGDHVKAEHFYRRAAQVDPFQVSGHINLGAILHLNGHWQEAEMAYLRALQLDSLNNIATENLQKLRNLMMRQSDERKLSSN